jgi:PKD repeat protein
VIATSCGGNEVFFDGSGSKHESSYLWRFEDDGSTSTSATVTHQFPDGTWSVVLTLQGPGGSSSDGVTVTTPC